jgi:predicted dehydrogenase
MRREYPNGSENDRLRAAGAIAASETVGWRRERSQPSIMLDSQTLLEVTLIKVAVIGLGKMGLSHHAMFNAHPEVDVVGICDSSGYVLSVLKKYTGISTYSDFDAMLSEVELDAVVIATPSSSHVRMVEAALERGLHVFCEKPFTLDPRDAERLTAHARERGLVTQVGYHNRFVGAFGEVKTLLNKGAIGEVTHALGEAYGPVVLKQKGGTWRSQRTEGGGCLYDYAAHAIDLLDWYLGEPAGVGGTVLNSVFSREIDDEVYGTLYYPEGRTGQLSVNWSDESHRKMTTRITLWGTTGRIYVDRQECQVYLRDTARIPDGYEEGWNIRYTTELTAPVWFYLRGEEYSAQIEAFVQRVKERRVEGLNDFASATVADRVIAMMVADASRGASTGAEAATAQPMRRRRRRGLLRRLRTQASS